MNEKNKFSYNIPISYGFVNMRPVTYYSPIEETYTKTRKVTTDNFDDFWEELIERNEDGPFGYLFNESLKKMLQFRIFAQKSGIVEER